MGKNDKGLEHLPQCARDYIKSVIRKMGYRKKVRDEVMEELAGHFDDAIRGCETTEAKEEKARELISKFGDSSLLGKLIRRGKKRCRSLWRTVVVRTFQAIGIFILLVIFYCVHLSLGKPSVRVNYVEQMNELSRSISDESLNAAPIYEKAIELYAANSPGEEDNEQAHTTADILKKLYDKKIDEMDEEEIGALKGWLVDIESAIALFKQASEKPMCSFERESADGTLLNVTLPELSKLRHITQALCLRARLIASEGQIEDAFDDLVTCYRAGGHLRGKRTIIEQLVGMATEKIANQEIFSILNNYEISSAQLKELYEKWHAVYSQKDWLVHFDTERLLVQDMIQRCYTDDGKGSGRMIPGQFVKHFGELTFNDEAKAIDAKLFQFGAFLGLSLIGESRRSVQQKFDDTYDRYQNKAKITPFELSLQEDFKNEWDSEGLLERTRNFTYYMLVPALSRMINMSYQSQTSSNCLIVTISVLRYQKDKGVYPESLDELVAEGYIGAVPMDPFSDKALVYRKTEDGFTLYSAGTNFVDDGGRIGQDENGKSRIWGSDGDAVFWPIEEVDFR